MTTPDMFGYVVPLTRKVGKKVVKLGPYSGLTDKAKRERLARVPFTGLRHGGRLFIFQPWIMEVPGTEASCI